MDALLTELLFLSPPEKGDKAEELDTGDGPDYVIIVCFCILGLCAVIIFYLIRHRGQHGYKPVQLQLDHGVKRFSRIKEVTRNLRNTFTPGLSNSRKNCITRDTQDTTASTMTTTTLHLLPMEERKREAENIPYPRQVVEETSYSTQNQSQVQVELSVKQPLTMKTKLSPRKPKVRIECSPLQNTKSAVEEKVYLCSNNTSKCSLRKRDPVHNVKSHQPDSPKSASVLKRSKFSKTNRIHQKDSDDSSSFIQNAKNNIPSHEGNRNIISKAQTSKRGAGDIYNSNDGKRKIQDVVDFKYSTTSSNISHTLRSSCNIEDKKRYPHNKFVTIKKVGWASDVIPVSSPNFQFPCKKSEAQRRQSDIINKPDERDIGGQTWLKKQSGQMFRCFTRGSDDRKGRTFFKSFKPLPLPQNQDTTGDKPKLNNKEKSPLSPPQRLRSKEEKVKSDAVGWNNREKNERILSRPSMEQKMQNTNRERQQFMSVKHKGGFVSRDKFGDGVGRNYTMSSPMVDNSIPNIKLGCSYRKRSAGDRSPTNKIKHRKMDKNRKIENNGVLLNSPPCGLELSSSNDKLIKANAKQLCKNAVNSKLYTSLVQNHKYEKPNPWKRKEKENTSETTHQSLYPERRINDTYKTLKKEIPKNSIYKHKNPTKTISPIIKSPVVCRSPGKVNIRSQNRMNPGGRNSSMKQTSNRFRESSKNRPFPQPGLRPSNKSLQSFLERKEAETGKDRQCFLWNPTWAQSNEKLTDISKQVQGRKRRITFSSNDVETITSNEDVRNDVNYFGVHPKTKQHLLIPKAAVKEALYQDRFEYNKAQNEERNKIIQYFTELASPVKSYLISSHDKSKSTCESQSKDNILSWSYVSSGSPDHTSMQPKCSRHPCSKSDTCFSIAEEWCEPEANTCTTYMSSSKASPYKRDKSLYSFTSPRQLKDMSSKHSPHNQMEFQNKMGVGLTVSNSVAQQQSASKRSPEFKTNKFINKKMKSFSPKKKPSPNMQRTQNRESPHSKWGINNKAPSSNKTLSRSPTYFNVGKDAASLTKTNWLTSPQTKGNPTKQFTQFAPERNQQVITQSNLTLASKTSQSKGFPQFSTGKKPQPMKVSELKSPGNKTSPSKQFIRFNFQRHQQNRKANNNQMPDIKMGKNKVNTKLEQRKEQQVIKIHKNPSPADKTSPTKLLSKYSYAKHRQNMAALKSKSPGIKASPKKYKPHIEPSTENRAILAAIKQSTPRKLENVKRTETKKKNTKPSPKLAERIEASLSTLRRETIAFRNKIRPALQGKKGKIIKNTIAAANKQAQAEAASVISSNIDVSSSTKKEFIVYSSNANSGENLTPYNKATKGNKQKEPLNGYSTNKESIKNSDELIRSQSSSDRPPTQADSEAFNNTATLSRNKSMEFDRSLKVKKQNEEHQNESWDGPSTASWSNVNEVEIGSFPHDPFDKSPGQQQDGGSLASVPSCSAKLNSPLLVENYSFGAEDKTSHHSLDSENEYCLSPCVLGLKTQLFINDSLEHIFDDILNTQESSQGEKSKSFQRGKTTKESSGASSTESFDGSNIREHSAFNSPSIGHDNSSKPVEVRDKSNTREREAQPMVVNQSNILDIVANRTKQRNSINYDSQTSPSARVCFRKDVGHEKETTLKENGSVLSAFGSRFEVDEESQDSQDCLSWNLPCQSLFTKQFDSDETNAERSLDKAEKVSIDDEYVKNLALEEMMKHEMDKTIAESTTLNFEMTFGDNSLSNCVDVEANSGELTLDNVIHNVINEKAYGTGLETDGQVKDRTNLQTFTNSSSTQEVPDKSSNKLKSSERIQFQPLPYEWKTKENITEAEQDTYSNVFNTDTNHTTASSSLKFATSDKTSLENMSDSRFNEKLLDHQSQTEQQVSGLKENGVVKERILTKEILNTDFASQQCPQNFGNEICRKSSLQNINVDNQLCMERDKKDRKSSSASEINCNPVDLQEFFLAMLHGKGLSISKTTKRGSKRHGQLRKERSPSLKRHIKLPNNSEPTSKRCMTVGKKCQSPQKVYDWNKSTESENPVQFSNIVGYKGFTMTDVSPAPSQTFQTDNKNIDNFEMLASDNVHNDEGKTPSRKCQENSIKGEYNKTSEDTKEKEVRAENDKRKPSTSHTTDVCKENINENRASITQQYSKSQQPHWLKPKSRPTTPTKKARGELDLLPFLPPLSPKYDKGSKTTTHAKRDDTNLQNSKSKRESFKGCKRFAEGKEMAIDSKERNTRTSTCKNKNLFKGEVTNLIVNTANEETKQQNHEYNSELRQKLNEGVPKQAKQTAERTSRSSNNLVMKHHKKDNQKSKHNDEEEVGTKGDKQTPTPTGDIFQATDKESNIHTSQYKQPLNQINTVDTYPNQNDENGTKMQHFKDSEQNNSLHGAQNEYEHQKEEIPIKETHYSSTSITNEMKDDNITIYQPPKDVSGNEDTLRLSNITSEINLVDDDNNEVDKQDHNQSPKPEDTTYIKSGEKALEYKKGTQDLESLLMSEICKSNTSLGRRKVGQAFWDKTPRKRRQIRLQDQIGLEAVDLKTPVVKEKMCDMFCKSPDQASPKELESLNPLPRKNKSSNEMKQSCVNSHFNPSLQSRNSSNSTLIETSDKPNSRMAVKSAKRLAGTLEEYLLSSEQDNSRNNLKRCKSEFKNHPTFTVFDDKTTMRRRGTNVSLRSSKYRISGKKFEPASDMFTTGARSDCQDSYRKNIDREIHKSVSERISEFSKQISTNDISDKILVSTSTVNSAIQEGEFKTDKLSGSKCDRPKQECPDSPNPPSDAKCVNERKVVSQTIETTRIPVTKRPSRTSVMSSDIDLSWAESTMESTFTWLTEPTGNDNANHADYYMQQDKIIMHNSIAIDEVFSERTESDFEDIFQKVEIEEISLFQKSYIGNDLRSFLFDDTNDDDSIKAVSEIADEMELVEMETKDGLPGERHCSTVELKETKSCILTDKRKINDISFKISKRNSSILTKQNITTKIAGRSTLSKTRKNNSTDGREKKSNVVENTAHKFSFQIKKETNLHTNGKNQTKNQHEFKSRDNKRSTNSEHSTVNDILIERRNEIHNSITSEQNTETILQIELKETKSSPVSEKQTEIDRLTTAIECQSDTFNTNTPGCETADLTCAGSPMVCNESNQDNPANSKTSRTTVSDNYVISAWTREVSKKQVGE